jgi:hypothetical protein
MSPKCQFSFLRAALIVRSFFRPCIVAVTIIALTVPARAGTKTPGATPAPSGKMVYKRYSITDDQGFKGMEVVHGVMPTDWTLKGGVTWKMNLSQPDLFRIHWGDSQDVRAFDIYPFLSFAWSSDAERGVYQPGQVVLGNVVARPPADQFEAFDKVIVQQFRPDLARAKIVNKEKMPDQAKKIYDQVNTDPNDAVMIAVGKETFEYELNGKTVQEVVSGVLKESRYKVNNPKGVTYWSLSYASSKRAPAGELDSLTPLRDVMVQSLQFNPAWSQKVADLISQRRQKALAAQRQQAANQQAQFNAIESRISSQTAANEAQHQSYWQHSADLAVQSENRADVMRQVSPWKTSDGSTYKLPTQYGNAWAGANGQIIMNNDSGYNPNSDPSLTPTQWTPMEPTHN